MGLEKVSKYKLLGQSLLGAGGAEMSPLRAGVWGYCMSRVWFVRTVRTRSSDSACPVVGVGMDFSALSCVINLHFQGASTLIRLLLCPFS